MIDSPCFVPTRVASNTGNELYHYTTPWGLLGILRSMRLRSSSLKSLNDLQELNLRQGFAGGDFNYERRIQDYILNHCSTISFSSDYSINNGKWAMLGTNHPAMWAHYSFNNHGACIILDRKEFINLNNLNQSNTIVLDHVDYGLGRKITSLENDKHDPENFVIKHRKELFFHKHLDWQSECEQRVWGIDIPQEGLSILGAIKYIVLGNKFFHPNNKLDNSPSTFSEDLVKLIFSNSYQHFGYITPHSFAFAIPGNMGYIEVTSHPLFDKFTLTLRNGKQYDKWLNSIYLSHE